MPEYLLKDKLGTKTYKSNNTFVNFDDYFLISFLSFTHNLWLMRLVMKKSQTYQEIVLCFVHYGLYHIDGSHCPCVILQKVVHSRKTYAIISLPSNNI